MLGGNRVSKADARIDAIGTLDELNAHVGLISDILEFENHELFEIQNDLFIIGSHLANDGSKTKLKLPQLPVESISRLETAIDRMDDQLPKMTHFILPGGHMTISHIHISRSVCRRAERKVVVLGNDTNDFIYQYLNRLSDYLFVFARWVGQQSGIPERKWIPDQ